MSVTLMLMSANTLVSCSLMFGIVQMLMTGWNVVLDGGPLLFKLHAGNGVYHRTAMQNRKRILQHK